MDGERCDLLVHVKIIRSYRKDEDYVFRIRMCDVVMGEKIRFMAVSYGHNVYGIANFGY